MDRLSHSEADGRESVPKARALAVALYAWRDARLVGVLGLIAAGGFIAFAAAAPALTSATPLSELITPIGEARALRSGGAALTEIAAPFPTAIMMLADALAPTPGRAHLAAEAIAAILIALVGAYVFSARFPAVIAIMLTAATALFAPVMAPAQTAFALFVLAATTLLCAPGEPKRLRAVIEGALAGVLLAALWLTSPVVAAAGILALFTAPFFGALAGLVRYVGAAAVFSASILALETLAPGFNLMRVDAVQSALGASEGVLTVSAGGVASFILILIVVIFGGGAHWRGWGAAAVIFGGGVIAGRCLGADPALVYAAAAVVAAFSTASPFYDGVFGAPDRAGVTLALSAAAVAVLSTGALLVESAGALRVRHAAAASASGPIYAELGIVRPVASSAPAVDQADMLLGAAARVRQLSAKGVDAAILTGADAACVLADVPACSVDGAKAAASANVVLAPRVELDPATVAAKRRAEVMLYTEFVLEREEPMWDVWVRRGAKSQGPDQAP